MCDYFEVLLCTHKYRGLFNCCQSVCCLINLLPSQRVLGLKGRAPESQIDFCVGDEGCAVLHAKHSPAVATGALTQDPLAQGCAWSVQQWSHGCHRPQTCNSHELLTGEGGGYKRHAIATNLGSEMLWFDGGLRWHFIEAIICFWSTTLYAKLETKWAALTKRRTLKREIATFLSFYLYLFLVSAGYLHNPI